MTFLSQLAMLSILSLTITACGLFFKKDDGHNSGDGRPLVDNPASKIQVYSRNDNKEIFIDEFKLSVKVDEEFSSDNRQKFYDTFSSIKFYALSPDKNAFFSKFFESISGDTAAAKMYQYLASRTKYLVPQNEKNSRDALVASNTSSQIFLINRYNNFVEEGALRGPKESPPDIYFNSSLLPSDQLNIGLFSISKLFFDKHLSDFDRIDTMIHEARHSDCEVKPSTVDYKAFFRSGDFKSFNGCLHLHEKCPAGHELSGISACDERPWGSYSISFAVQNLISNYCKNCTEGELAIAKISEIDMRSRVKDAKTLLSITSSKPSLKHVEE